MGSKIFISYSHSDREWKERLVAQLKVLEVEGLIEIWEDSRIGAGDTWGPAVKAALEGAQFAFLLISARFLTSEFIRREEVPALIQRRKKGPRIFPLIIEESDWQSVPWLSALQVRPLDAVPLKSMSRSHADQALTAVVRELRTMIGPEKRGPQRRQMAAPVAVSTGKLPTVSRYLFGREHELKLLDQAWKDPATKIVSVVAWGGVGKSALVNHWVQKLGAKQYAGAERVYAWSFFSQGAIDRAAAGALFLEAALRWFGNTDPEQGSDWERGERLARLIRAQRVLLILDGLESLQFPFGPQEGELREQGLHALLRELAAENPGLCLITTRVPVKDLEEFEGGPARRIDLEHLSPEAGAQMLAALGVRGEPAELQQASREFDGHCLALQLLSSFITDLCNGDVKMRKKIGPLETDVRLGGQARRVMASYEAMFGPGPELALLRLLGFFDRPADPLALAAMRAQPVIPGLTEQLQGLSEGEWNTLVARLRRARLISHEDQNCPDVLDTHPLVREHFCEQVKCYAAGPSPVGSAWREGNSRLFEYFRSAAKPLPATLEEMEPLFQAVIHGCNAGRHQDAWRDVYMPRIARGHEGYAAFRLGALTALLGVLARFFENGQPIAPGPDRQGLSEPDQQRLLFETGTYLAAAVSYSAPEADRYFRHARKLSSEIDRPEIAVTILSAQWRFAVGKSQLVPALEIAREVHAIVKKTKSPDLLAGVARLLANPRFWMGRFKQTLRLAERGLEIEGTTISDENAGLFLTEPKINLMSLRAMANWHLGFPDKAVAQSLEAVKTARAFNHSHTLAVALWMDALVLQFRRDPKAVLEKAEAVITVSAKKFASWFAIGQVLKGWAWAQTGRSDEGIELIQRGIEGWRAAGLTLGRPYWLALWAEALAGAGRNAAALGAIEEAINTADESDRWWESELYRAQAELLWRLPDSRVRATECLRKAIALAHSRQAVTLELRAWTTAVRLGADLDADKSIALREIYSRFTEGFSSRDLVEAAAALRNSAASA